MKREHEINGELPSGYIKLEYIQSTGTQYINTGAIVPENFTIHANIETRRQNSNTATYFGVENSASPWCAIYARYDGSVVSIGCRGDAKQYSEFKDKVEIRISKNGTQKEIKYDDTEYLIGDTTYQHAAPYPMFIFCANLGGTAGRFSSMKLYGFEIYGADSTMRQFVPCIRKADNKPGLYDLCKSICPLTSTPFYVNSGTGEFLYK